MIDLEVAPDVVQRPAVEVESSRGEVRVTAYSPSTSRWSEAQRKARLRRARRWLQKHKRADKQEKARSSLPRAFSISRYRG